MPKAKPMIKSQMIYQKVKRLKNLWVIDRKGRILEGGALPPEMRALMQCHARMQSIGKKHRYGQLMQCAVVFEKRTLIVISNPHGHIIGVFEQGVDVPYAMLHMERCLRSV